MLKRALVLSLFLLPSVALADTSSVSFSVAGANGSGVTDAGLPCESGGDGASSWRYDYSGSVPSNGFSSAATALGLDIDLRSDAPGSAWLHPGSSDALLSNSRGTLALALSSGACGTPTFFFDGTTASGSGTWAAAAGTGSYRAATGSGTFNLVAQVAPGSDNAFSLAINGQVTVLDPTISAEVASALWDRATAQSDFRYANVTYRIANSGPGDAFDIELASAASSTPGVTVVGTFPASVGDIAAGDHALVTVRYQIDRGPCSDNTRGCAFDVDLSLEFGDALDNPDSHAAALQVRVPTAPPQR